MKTFLLLFHLLLVQYLPLGPPHSPVGGGGPVPAILQTGLNTVSGTYVATLPNHASGGMSCVLAALQSGGTSPTIVNTASFSWGSPITNLTNDGGWLLYVWCAATSSFGSTDTVTVTSTAVGGGIIFTDISNVSSVDASQGASNAGFGTITTGTFVVTGANDMVLAITVPHGGGVLGSGFTSFTSGGSGFWGNDAFTLGEYKQFTGTPVSANGGSASGWDILAVALK